MNNDSWLDNCIKDSLACDESKIKMNYGPLEKVRQRLKNDELMIWRVDMRSLFKKRTMKLSLLFALTFILIGSVIGVGAAALFKTDKIDYPFVDDQQVIGKWQSVDFVKSVGDFDPGKKSSLEDLFIKELAFIKNGSMLVSINEGNQALTALPLTWTKGMVINSEEKTASKYEIMDIEGSTYLFFEWKNSDYIFGGMEPNLYVLKKVDSNDYSNYEIDSKDDNIEYTFADDPQVLGKWNTVDYVDKIDKFNAEKKNWIPDLFLEGLEFDKDGKLIGSTENGSFSPDITWTKGLVLNPYDKTASAYVIKEINGSTYMFYEWKNGDYTFRGLKPKYYVLKKEQ